MKMRKKNMYGIMLASLLIFGVVMPIEAAEKDVIIEDTDNEVEVIRKSGSTRYDTAYAIADELKEQLEIEQFDTVIIASGSNFPDALSGSYLASVKNAPILLAKEKYADDLQKYIQENLISGGKIYILGGENAVPASIEKCFENDYEIERLKGKTRYETNLEILKEAGVDADEILISTGSGYADSLSASATGKPILLVGKTLLEEQKEFLEENADKQCYIIGGTGAVNEKMQDEIEKIMVTNRISGSTRYETSVMVAETFFEYPDTVTLAFAKNFPDGLCGGPLAKTMNAPLILTASRKESDAEEYIEKSESKTGITFGGANTLSDKTVRNAWGYIQNVSKKNYWQAVSDLEEVETYLRNGEIEKGIEYLEKVYAVTKDQTIRNFIKRLEKGGYNTTGIELQLGRELEVIDCTYGNVYKNTYDDLGRWIRMEGESTTAENPTKWYETYIYDEKGNHIQSNEYHKNRRSNTWNEVLVGSYKNSFDESGRCLKEEYYDYQDKYFGSEKALSYRLNYYDENGNYTGYDLYRNDFERYYDITIPRWKERYEYDSEGKLSSITEYNQAKYGICSEAYKTSYFYNESGNCVKEITYDGDNDWNSTKMYTYDAEGRCVKKITKESRYNEVTTYNYGLSLNLDSEIRNDGDYEIRTEYVYDETSLCIHSNTHHNWTGYYCLM